MEEIENTDAGKSLRYNVGEHRAGRVGVHRLQSSADVIKLRKAIYEDEDVGDLQLLRVPEEHPSADTNVAQGVVWNKVDHLLQLLPLARVLRVEFVQAVQPCELEELLGKEEAGDEVRLRAPEGKVAIVNV